MTNETVRRMTNGQRGDLVATMVGAIPSDLSFEEAQAIIGAKGPFVAEIRESFKKRRLCEIPLNDKRFKFVVNDVDPADVVMSAGFNATDWQCLGPKFDIDSIKTYRARLVSLRGVKSLEEARKKADELGYRLVEGQAYRSFENKFPVPDRTSSIIFGGSEWLDSVGRRRIFSLHSRCHEWSSRFYHSRDVIFSAKWRWLVIDK